MIGMQFLANSDAMKHKKRVEPNRDLYRPLLIDIINPNHELVRLESPYYQHFCGMTFFEHRLPIDPSSLVR